MHAGRRIWRGKEEGGRGGWGWRGLPKFSWSPSERPALSQDGAVGDVEQSLGGGEGGVPAEHHWMLTKLQVVM